MSYDYNIAKDVLTDAEKNRILCVYLNSSQQAEVNWDKATSEYGSASVESMKVSLRNSFKKVQKAMDAGGTAGVAAPTPAKKTPNSKRKKADAEGDSEKPKAKRGKKKATTPDSPTKTTEGAANEDENDGEVKEEVDEGV